MYFLIINEVFKIKIKKTLKNKIKNAYTSFDSLQVGQGCAQDLCHPYNQQHT
jgi:hypothetical protein